MLAAVDADRLGGAQRGDAEGHGNAVITVGPDFAAAHRAAINDDAVRQGFHLYAKSAQAVGHHLDAVTFLDTQLFGTTQDGTAFGTGSGNEQYRELVNRQWYQLLRDLDALQSASCAYGCRPRARRPLHVPARC